MEEVEYFEKYAPVISWTTFRLMLSLSINQGWATRQVDFSNNFFQATLLEDICLALPYYFESDTGEYRSNMVMMIIKNLYGMVKPPLLCYNDTKGGF